jgi:hypothetical protein
MICMEGRALDLSERKAATGQERALERALKIDLSITICNGRRYNRLLWYLH